MIYFCIPSYNEAETIGVLLWKIRQVMADFPRDYQFLVVNDASTDATEDVLEPYTRVLPLTVQHNERRHGYAHSVERMLREAVRRTAYPKRDVAVVLQGDFTDEPDDVPTLVKRIEGGADVVVGRAQTNGAERPRTQRWARRATLYLLRRVGWPEKVSDPLCGFRAYRLISIQKAIEALDGAPLLDCEGSVADARLLELVAPHARQIAEVDVSRRYDRRRRETRQRPLGRLHNAWRFLRLERGGSNGKWRVRKAGHDGQTSNRSSGGRAKSGRKISQSAAGA